MMEESEFRALVSLLDDEDPQVVDMVTEKILSLGNDIVPFLESEWEKSFNPLVQERIENITHLLQYEQVKIRLREWYESEDQDLLTGMWAVATYQYPDLELEKLKQDIEQVYYEVWLNFKQGLHPYDQVKILNGLLFWTYKFSANLKNFHSPSNSYINCVLESKKGNPISLCIIYLIIARKLKLPISGVNLPNLFVLTYKDPKYPQFYINAYNKGLIFSRDDIENYIKELKMEPIDSFFEPCSNAEIIRRVFRNLIQSYKKAGEKEKEAEVSELLEVITSPGDIF